MKAIYILITITAMLLPATAGAQQPAWGDMGDGTYRNPVLNADYSDPDVVRVGDKYYMVASDFHFMGMQVLESADLVNWHIVSQIYDRLDYPGWNSNKRYAGGSWAPSIRWHDGRLWVFFCTPHEGLFMTTATDPAGPWTPLHCVKRVKKWEDPCPLWDDDGQAYLGHSVHGAGPIIVHRMSADGRELLDEGRTVYEGPVAEGTKWLKRDGRYYLSIPEGGVGEGWQTLLRADNIYGPYERRVVLEQGSTQVNGPHQGALVDTPDGQEWWFVHFQATTPLGRVMHLQPAQWTDDGWLTIGEDYDGNGIGEPVASYRKPCPANENDIRPELPQTADEFTADNLYWRGGQQSALGLQWQWCHNPVDSAWSLSERDGWLTLHALPADSLRDCRGMLTQKVTGYRSEATTLIDCRGLSATTFAGLLCTGKQFRAIGVSKDGIFIECDGRREMIASAEALSADAASSGVSTTGAPRMVWLRVTIDNNINRHSFSYSTDGTTFHPVGEPFAMREGYWKGLRIGLFAYNFADNGAETAEKDGNNKGMAQFDFFHYDIME